MNFMDCCYHLEYISNADEGKGYWRLLLTFKHWMSFVVESSELYGGGLYGGGLYGGT